MIAATFFMFARLLHCSCSNIVHGIQVIIRGKQCVHGVRTLYR